MFDSIDNRQRFQFALKILSTDYSPPEKLKAIRLLEYNVSEGDPYAQILLAHFYKQGQHVVQDNVRATALACSAYDLCRNHLQDNPGLAELLVGHLFYVGLGVTQDFDKARACLQKSAKYNNPHAKYLLGTIYFYDKVAIFNPKLALESLLEGAKKNVPYIQCALADMQRALGEDQSALHWYQESAKQGDGKALFRLGEMHLYGDHLEQSYEMALAYFEKSTQQHYPDAFVMLGLFYEFGFGIESNPVTGEKFFKTAQKLQSPLAGLLSQARKLARGETTNFDSLHAPKISPFFSSNPIYHYNYLAIIDWFSKSNNPLFKVMALMAKTHGLIGITEKTSEVLHEIHESNIAGKAVNSNASQALTNSCIQKKIAEINNSGKKVALDFSNMGLTMVQIKSLIKTAVDLEKLISIDLSECHINDADIKELVGLFQVSWFSWTPSYKSLLSSMKLVGNKISDEGAKLLLNFASACGSLEKINLQGNLVTETMMVRIGECLEKNQMNNLERTSPSSVASSYGLYTRTLCRSPQRSGQSATRSDQVQPTLLTGEPLLKILRSECSNELNTYRIAYNFLRQGQVHFIEAFVNPLLEKVFRLPVSRSRIVDFLLVCTKASLSQEQVLDTIIPILQQSVQRADATQSGLELHTFAKLKHFKTQIESFGGSEMTQTRWQKALRFHVLTAKPREPELMEIQNPRPMLA